MTLIVRPSLHRRDVITFDDRIANVSRRIENYTNYLPLDVDQARDADPDLEDRVQAPDHWEGAWDFRKACLRTHSQSFVGWLNNETIPQCGGRDARRQWLWYNMRALGFNTGITPEYTRGTRRARWVDIWDDVDLEISLGKQGADLKLIIKAGGHPGRFDFSLHGRISTYILQGGWGIRDASGRVAMSTSPLLPTPADGGVVSSFVQRRGADIVGPQNTFKRLVVEIDTTGASYPVVLQ
jgi:hypothetical protein